MNNVTKESGTIVMNNLATEFSLADIPPMPRVAADILHQLNNSDSSAKGLAEIIAVDPAVAARVLRIANSSFYSMSRQVTNLSMAIVVLGERTLKNLVLAASLRGLNRVFGPKEKMLWEDSMVCALASRFMSRALAIGDPEDAFVDGLFRHIGLIVMNNHHSENFDPVFEALCKKTARAEIERIYFGATHGEIGAMVLEHWKLSEGLCHICRYHDNLEGAPAAHEDLHQRTALINVTSYFPGYFGIFSSPWQIDLAATPGARQLTLDTEKMTALVAEFKEIFNQNRQQFLS
jgi:HD-like signal output (HDOD) protein